MKSLLFIGGLCFVCWSVACGSSDTSGAGSRGAGNSAGAAASGSAGSPPSSAGNANGGANPSSTGGGSSSAGNASSTAGAPPGDCQKYCTCEAMNCAGQAIPSGQACLDFCAGMSTDQYACRMNMCGLVPAQPNNDHCKHSVGIDQCQ